MSRDGNRAEKGPEEKSWEEQLSWSCSAWKRGGGEGWRQDRGTHCLTVECGQEGLALLPGSQHRDERKCPEALPGELQDGHGEEFFDRKHN